MNRIFNGWRRLLMHIALHNYLLQDLLKAVYETVLDFFFLNKIFGI